MTRPATDIVVEFAGMPKSGKTTVMNSVSQHLRRSGYIVDEFHGGGRLAPIGKDHLASLNMYLGAGILQKLVSIGFPDGLPPRVHLLDRGPFDRLVFGRALLALGRLEPGDVDPLAAAYAAPILNGRVDLTFAFMTEPEISLMRENQNSLRQTEGRVMNRRLLEALRDATIELLEAGPFSWTQHVELVDTGAYDGDVRTCASRVIKRVANIAHDADLDVLGA